MFASMRNPDAGAALRARAASAGWRLRRPPRRHARRLRRGGGRGLLRETGGRLDVLVNNAGYYAFGPLEETSPDELRAQLETNVVGVHRVTRAVLPAMRARGPEPCRWARSRAVAAAAGRPVPRVQVGAGGDDRGVAARADPFRRPGGTGRAWAASPPRCTPTSGWRPRPGASDSPTPSSWQPTAARSAQIPRVDGPDAPRRRHRTRGHRAQSAAVAGWWVPRRSPPAGSGPSFPTGSTSG